MSLVTIATFANAFNMNVVRGRLESEGIPAFPKDEHTVTTNPFYNGALGGIKLQVREEDVPEAQRILAESGYRQPQPQPPVIEKRKNPFLSFLKFILFFAAALALIYLLHDPLAYLEPVRKPIELPLPIPHKNSP
ncbi:DUF2007 domain-containing protein [Polluticoccus soli]|uniref:putative signal transducing protein n=1 Tax=Polluticoccus soli TaxID=3034150 RepID=UPI0023E2A537|nr:DUF2007 domain-containing protein [Flavipsychrobacter sp. JY13-12]